MKKSILIKFSIVAIFALFVSFSVSFLVIRTKTVDESKQRAWIIAELVRDTLTSYMLMGVMDKRYEFLDRIMEIEGVKEIRVIRGEEVIKQFGKGLKIEVPRDDIEKAVLKNGEPIEQLKESFERVIYRIVIPYKAIPIKGINCLACHEAQEGAVLGAISLTLDLTHARSVGIMASAVVFTSFLLAFGLTFFFINHILTKLTDFIIEISKKVELASKGNFTYDVRTDLEHEAKLLNETLTSFFLNLGKTLNSIEDKVVAIIGYSTLKTGNPLSDTRKIVDELLNIYRFKKVIEKDKTKEDVYKRIIQVLEDHMSLESFSIYEVSQRENRLIPIYVNGSESWCNKVIFENPEGCRAKRSGLDVDSSEFSCICPNFIACKEGKLYYYCIPTYVGGSVGNIVQIVYEEEMEPFIKLLIPYIKRYLEEASPVLEARIYMSMLEEQSLRDQLTGLYNRRYLSETIDKIVAQIKRRGTRLGILMIDADHFKNINDTYGHDVGDKVLKEVSKVIQKSIRESDIAIRFGGEEFMVLLMDVEEGASEKVAEKIRRAVEAHKIEIFGIVIRETVSIGVSEFPVDSDNIWQCIKFADIALYRAKELGRNTVVRFKPELLS